MQIDWSQLLNRRVLAWGAGVLVLLLFFPSLFHLTFASRNEVSFSASPGINTCRGVFIEDSDEAETCVTSYQITLGNTGTELQHQVTVALSPAPTMVRFGANSLDIVASAERLPAPRVSQQTKGDALEFLIEDLHPNRLVEIRFTTRGLAAFELLKTMETKVYADGVVIDTNPHVTVIARFARAVFGLFGA